MWQSEQLSHDVTSRAGGNDSLLVADVDLDGRQEILVNTGGVGVDIYEVSAP